MDKNTSKARVAADPHPVAVALMNASATGASLFVINLCASQAPVANVGKALPGLESYRLYQVARREDGRTRYRLRLGFFTSEADAEAVLSVVRSSYPTAFTACLCDEDRKFARGFAPEPVERPAPPKIAVVVENKPVARPVSPPPAPAKPAAATPAKPSAAAPRTASPAAPAAARGPASPPKAPAPAAQAARTPTTAQAAQGARTSTKAPAPATAAARTPTKAPAPAAQTVRTPATKPPAAPASTAKPAAAQAKAAPPKPAIEAPSKLRAAIELSLESEPAPAPKAAASTPSSEPFRVSKGVEIPATSLSLETTAKMRAVANPAAAAPAKPAAKPAAPAAQDARMQRAHASAGAPVAAKAPAQPAADPSRMRAAQAAAPGAIRDPARDRIANLPELDSTQTIRALTSDELQDESEKWFAIQLAVSDQPVNLDAMPRLDIFEAYRLYSVATAGSGKITHALRIGFFREEVSAEAVCGYLTTFFGSPTVVRISIAEHSRFKDPPASKPAPKAEVLDLSHARDRTPKPIPTVTMAVEAPRFDPSATGTFKTSATGMHKALSSTGVHRALGATGTHNALKSAASPPPATKRSAPLSKTSATGKHSSLQTKKSLEEQLLEEAREVELAASGIRKLPKNDSLLSKMFGKRSKS